MIKRRSNHSFTYSPTTSTSLFSCNGSSSTLGSITEQRSCRKFGDLNRSFTTTRLPESTSGQQTNEIVPGIRFGRFFGTIEEATERQIKRRMSQRLGVEPTHLEVVTETIKEITNGREVSVEESILMKKIAELENKVLRYEKENPKIKKENEELRQLNQSLLLQDYETRKNPKNGEVSLSREIKTSKLLNKSTIEFASRRTETLKELQNMDNQNVGVKMLKTHRVSLNLGNNQLRLSAMIE